MIRYENGSKDLFNGKQTNSANVDLPQSTVKSGNSDFSINMYDKGRTDADLYYRGFSGAKTGTLLVAGLISPLGGLIPAVICASSPPQEFNLNPPNSELMRNPEYQNAYKMEAFKIKKRKTWGGWAIGSAIAITTYIIVASANGQ